jgi:hypothetical protein
MPAMNGFMTTNSETFKTEDEPRIHLGAVIGNEERSQSAAVRGATQAFSARGDSQPQKDLKNSTNGARAAAISAGYAARQRSVSPPKPPVSALTTPARSQLARISQVQQLVKGFEHSSTGENRRLPKIGEGAPGRVLSRSPSQIAARIASSSSPSPLRIPLPLRRAGEDSSPTAEAQEPHSNQGSNKAALENQCKSTESVQSSGHATMVNAPRPLRPASGAQKRPSLPESERDPTRENTSAASLLNHPLQGSSSIAAAQAAAKNLVSFNLLAVPETPQSKSEDMLDSVGGLSEDLERGRSSTGRRVTCESQVVVGNNALDRRISDESPSTFNERELGCESSGIMRASEPEAHLRTPSAQSRPRFSSTSSAKYTDERTGLTERSLADAIVASSLASSRAPSPIKIAAPAPPPPRRPSVSRSIFRHRQSSETDLSRHASPHKGIRQTLRKHPSDDNEDEHTRRKHKHFMKHPNKHREGSRKRWKDKVTERERKRYEGVWAANKGMFLTTPLSVWNAKVTAETLTSELVLDLVVRDLWSRSRLPADALAEIWDLVDRQGVGILTRDEFVLGLWLIDQRLKGRKLPIRVSTTLWASVRYAGGAKIPCR